MLRWQLLNRDKKEYIALQLVLLSLVAHTLCGVMLFFLYRHDSAVINLHLNASVPTHAASVMMVATTQEQLRSSQQHQKSGRSMVESAQKNIQNASTTAIVATKSAPKKVIPVQEKKTKPAEKTRPKQSVVQAEKIEKKEVSKKIPKKDEKILTSKKLEEQKTPVVYGTAREVEMRRQQEVLTQEITQYWKPPVGVAAGCACHITFTVNWQGELADVAITEPSGVLMYDLAARSAIYTMKMPEWAKGKTFTVVLHNKV